MSTIDKLVEVIAAHNHRYFVEHKPVISDAAFDALVEELRALDPYNAALTYLGERSATSSGVRHAVPMLSLHKCYEERVLVTHLRKIAGALLVQPKYDGISIELTYDANGELETASTRGDGDVGENVTAALQYVTGVPASLHHQHAMQVRGELYMPKSVFAAKYKDAFANTRNIVAGAIARTEQDAIMLTDMRFVAYDVVCDSWNNDSDASRLEQLEDMYGFTTADYMLAETPKQAIEFVVAMRERTYDCDLDGIVVKADSLMVREALGVTEHHPRWANALKFQGDSGTTQLTNVHWQIGRTGAITPVAQFEPVLLSGAWIGEASLHNVSRVHALQLHIGDTIEVTRRGGVIPHVERVVESRGGVLVEQPAHCPSCERPLNKVGMILQCTNGRHCDGTRIERLKHWCKVTGMLGIGPAICEDLYYKGDVDEPSLLYSKGMPAVLASLFGKVRCESLQYEIDKTRVLDVVVFLTALGIDTLGEGVAKKLVKHYGTLHAIAAATEKELTQVPGIGERYAQIISLQMRDQRRAINSLLQHIRVVERTPREGPFAGMVFVFTGEIEGVSREDAQAQVTALGAECPSSTTIATTHLVVGTNAGATKVSKAEAYNLRGAHIAIISADEFLTILAEAWPLCRL